MKEKVIDPSEILIDSEGTIRDKPEIANPWIRFLGRLFDYAWFFLALYAIKSLLIHKPMKYEGLIPLEYVLWIPVEAFFLWALGTTPGKWWFRTEIRQGRLTRLDYVTALRRAFRVWTRGIGLGIPFVNALCMLVAYHRLKALKITSWDRDDHIQVTHLPISRFRLGLGAFIAIGGVLAYYLLSSNSKIG